MQNEDVEDRVQVFNERCFGCAFCFPFVVFILILLFCCVLVVQLYNYRNSELCIVWRERHELM